MILASVIFSIVISGAEVAEGAKITVTMVGNSVYNFDEKNRLVRASVNVANYNPGDGYYYMQIIQPNTGKVIKESEILITERDNDMWGAEIASMINDEAVIQNGKIVQGDYTLNVFTSQGTMTGSTKFSIIKPSEQVKKNQEENETPLDVQTTNSPKTQEPAKPEQDEHPELDTVPEWVKNIALWFGQGMVSEEEFIDAIKYLIEQGIIKV